MAVLKIVEYPHPILSTRTTPVNEFGPILKEFVTDLRWTMYASGGIGLAANQVGSSLRLFVVDESLYPEDDSRRPEYVFINPRITPTTPEKKTLEEGCLSFPGLAIQVPRFETIDVTANDETGREFSLRASGLLSQVIQHELDHLEGITFLDRVGPIVRGMAQKRYQKLRNR